MENQDKKFWSLLLKLSLPIALQHLLINSLTFVDTFFMSQLGDVALSASGMASQCNWLLSMVSFGVCSGTAIFVSQLWGAEKIDEIKKTYAIAFLLSLFAASLFFILSFFIPEKIMSIFNNDEMIVKYGSMYLRAVSFSYIPTVLNSVFSTVLRSTEKVKLPMFVSLVTTSVNIVLDYALVFGAFSFPRMGITGAAIATSISAWLGLSILLILSFYQKNIIIMPIKNFISYTVADFIFFIKKALPVIVNEILWGLGMVVINAIYSNTGYENYAACTILRTIESLCLIMFIGLNDGGAVIIGKTVGENKLKLAYNYSKKLAISVPVLSLIIGSIVIFSRNYVINFFNISGNITEYTISIASILVIIYGLEIAFRNIPYTMICAIFRPGGDSITGAKYDFICLWFFAIPVTYIISSYTDLPFYLVFLVEYLVEDIPKAVMCIKHFVSKKWIKPVVKLDLTYQ